MKYFLKKSIFIKYRGSPDRGIVLILYFQGILLETDSVLKITFYDLDFRLNHNLARTTLWPGPESENRESGTAGRTGTAVFRFG